MTAQPAEMTPTEIRTVIARARLDESTGVATDSQAFEVLRFYGDHSPSRLIAMTGAQRWELLMDIDGRFVSTPPAWASSAFLIQERNGDETCTHVSEPRVLGIANRPRETFEVSLARVDRRTEDGVDVGAVSVLLHSNDDYAVLAPEVAEALSNELASLAAGAREEQEKAGRANDRQNHIQSAGKENDHG